MAGLKWVQYVFGGQNDVNIGIQDMNCASRFDRSYLTWKSLCGAKLVKSDDKRDETEQEC